MDRVPSIAEIRGAAHGFALEPPECRGWQAVLASSKGEKEISDQTSVWSLIFCFPNYILDFQFVVFSSTSSTQVMKTNEFLIVVGQPILNRLAAPKFLSLWVLQSITRFGQPPAWHCHGVREFSRFFAKIDPIAQCCPKVCPLSPSTARRQLRHTFFWVILL